MKKCLNCNNKFNFSNKKILYCCKKCSSNAKARRHYARYGSVFGKKGLKIKYLCEFCGKKYKPTRKKQKYCSHECSSSAQRKYLTIPECLEDASRKLDKNIGYIRVYCPMHPKANTWGYVYEHRLIAEGMIGRHLEKGEHVHHVNGKRWDNRPENLKVMMASEHSKLTAKENK